MKMSCKTCKHSMHNNATHEWCIFSPCGNWSRYESIYTIEPPIVLGTRFYTPQTNDEQVVIAPMVLSIEEEE